MENSEQKNTSLSCSVCRKINKAKQPTALIVALVVVCVLLAVFMTLYLADGNIIAESEVNVEIDIDNELKNGSTANDNIVTGNGSTISGKIEVEDNSILFLAITIIFSCLIITGGICYVNKSHRKTDN